MIGYFSEGVVKLVTLSFNVTKIINSTYDYTVENLMAVRTIKNVFPHTKPVLLLSVKTNKESYISAKDA